MRIAFFGTPEVAVPALEHLAATHEIAVVVTQPAKPQGRGRTIAPSPVQVRAEELGLPVLAPASPRDDGFVEALRAHRVEALAIVAYGHILRPDVLEVAPALNAHFSMLPAYRGAAPVQRAIMDGATRTGVSVFLLEPTVDTGPVLAIEAVDIDPEETSGELLERLAPIGARLLGTALTDLAAGRAHGVPQDPAAASPAPKITAADAQIDWGRPAREIANQVRALNPRPGAATTFRGKRFQVWRARVEAGDAPPGLLAGPALVGTTDGVLRLVIVQPEGKKALYADEWARGARPTPGESLGSG